MISEVNIWPSGVFGVMSPNPTVVIVTTAQYIDCGIEVNPCSGPSISHIAAPKMSTRVRKVLRKTRIFLRLRISADQSRVASPT